MPMPWLDRSSKLITLAIGCGSSRPVTTHHAQTTIVVPVACTTRARSALAARLGVSGATISATPFIAGSGAPSCHYVVRRIGRGPIGFTANVDTAPQAYCRLEREVVESGQQFASQRESPVPEQVTGLGLDADWFPAEAKLMTTDGTRLITIGVNWPASSQPTERTVAEAAAKAYLPTQAQLPRAVPVCPP
jgi:hypothetical protein